MENFVKNNKPVALIGGIAAALAVGYLVFGGRKAEQVPDSESEVAHEDTQPEVLENNFFLDPNATDAENEKAIIEWMKS